MFTLILVLIVIVAILLVLIVVIQNSKGGGLAAGFSSSNQVMGVRKTTDFLEKGTWWLAGILVGLCVLSTLFIPRATEAEDSIIKDDIIETTTNQDASSLPPAFDQVPEQPEAGQSAPEE